MASCTSPRVSLSTLPISRVISRECSSLRPIKISAARKTNSARRGAGTNRHLAKARLAASTAASTSALADFWKMPTRSRVSAGLRFSKVSPVEDSTHSPSIKFLNTLVGWLLPRVVGEASVSVAMSSPYIRLNIDATAGREGAARERAHVADLKYVFIGTEALKTRSEIVES